ncbi:YaaA family protein [Microbacterium sp. C7(2022)]|uniref:YaaA family protein n=1 Tax=Microbacterium sp. C7(2022) TaxID=2992759 RepID=UPI00237B9B4D|nr:peroxide stress protein YaaA [Microbacterium sp. C7(2022)]MDE0547217.1 peroxide stress protein YaaA [Microbacterium sp. C7(2022)]
MLILLPPSETKRDGGRRVPLDMTSWHYPSLAGARSVTVDALVELASDEDACRRVLRLGPSQAGEVAVNAALRTSPTMPAIDRYTGVLYDALDASSLDAPARRWLGAHVRVHSAPFGLVGALDAIPRYRLGAGVSLPGLGSAARVWRDATTAALGAEASRFILDLRSEAYVALGPVPAATPSAYVRVVTESADGAVRAMNHFNKHAKGALVRALAMSRPRVSTRAGFHRWAEEAGWRTRDNDRGEVELFA